MPRNCVITNGILPIAFVDLSIASAYCSIELLNIGMFDLLLVEAIGFRALQAANILCALFHFSFCF